MIGLKKRICTKEVVFLGGPACRASVEIRCVQIAKAMGCQWQTDVRSISDVPTGMRVFVCVKPQLSLDEIELLSRRGMLVWDVHDFPPPEVRAHHYLVGSKRASETFEHLGPVDIIPHHHCNLTGIANPVPSTKRPAWIGRPYWCPDYDELDFHVYNSNQMKHHEVVKSYRNIGISLNGRAKKSESGFHAQINPGIKLINCFGFGIPSVSAYEPAYLEYGADCTIFSNPDDCRYWVHELQANEALYVKLRAACLRKAPHFSIWAIAKRYLQFFEGLCN